MASYHRTGRKSCRRHLENRKSVTLTLVRTPGNAIVGRVVVEDGQRLFLRRVRAKDIYRHLDGLTVGERILDQLHRWRVSLIRYTADDGIYEAPIDYFVRYAVPLDFERNPERQHILPRRLWPVRPEEPGPGVKQAMAHVEQLALEVPA